MRIGHTGNIPKLSTHPFHCTLDTWEQLYSTLGISQCGLSHPTVPWEWLDTVRIHQCLTNLTHLEYPSLSHSCHSSCSYCPSSGHTGNVPVGPTLCSLFLLSIPSHCTMGRNGHTGNVQSALPLALCSYCPSHPTVPREGMDTLGMYQSVLPLAYLPTPQINFPGLES